MQKYTAAQINNIKKFYRQGFSYPEIAKRTGVKVWSVGYYLKRMAPTDRTTTARTTRTTGTTETFGFKPTTLRALAKLVAQEMRVTTK